MTSTVCLHDNVAVYKQQKILACAVSHLIPGVWLAIINGLLNLKPLYAEPVFTIFPHLDLADEYN